MKYFYIFSIFISSFAISQDSGTLSFDGTNDYVDIGESANDIRTIELWFKLNNSIGAHLSTAQSIIVRNTPDEHEEIFLAFYQEGWTPDLSGRLVFGYNLQSNFDYEVASNSSTWEADRWYHVAGVIHPINGMAIYIDGVKQDDTDAVTSATETSTFPTSIGKWGDLNIRYFDGEIEDLRFSNYARYIENFTPPCPDLVSDEETKLLYNFEETTGSVVVDSSDYSMNGEVFGSSWSHYFICRNDPTNNIEALNTSNTFIAYPNPANDILNLHFSDTNKLPLSIFIYAIDGKFIRKYDLNEQDFFSVDVEDLRGLFFLRVNFEDNSFQDIKFVVE